MSEKKDRVWIEVYKKYLDELTVEEWQAMNEAHCDNDLRTCAIAPSEDEDKK